MDSRLRGNDTESAIVRRALRPSGLRPETVGVWLGVLLLRKSRRPQNRRSALPDFLYLCFFFINILALFPRICGCSADRRVCGPRLAREKPQTAESAVCATGLLYLCFVFINILALFPRFCGCSADRRVCGLRLAREKPQTAESAVCATGLFVLVLCFHKHSGFVPSILQSRRRRRLGITYLAGGARHDEFCRDVCAPPTLKGGAQTCQRTARLRHPTIKGVYLKSNVCATRGLPFLGSSTPGLLDRTGGSNHRREPQTKTKEHFLAGPILQGSDPLPNPTKQL